MLQSRNFASKNFSPQLGTKNNSLQCCQLAWVKTHVSFQALHYSGRQISAILTTLPSFSRLLLPNTSDQTSSSKSIGSLLLQSTSYEGVSKRLWTESITKYTLTTVNTRWQAIQTVTAAKITRLTQKMAIQLHLVTESSTICSSRARRPVRKLLDTPCYLSVNRTMRNHKRKYSHAKKTINLWRNLERGKRQDTQLRTQTLKKNWINEDWKWKRKPLGNLYLGRSHFELRVMSLSRVMMKTRPMDCAAQKLFTAKRWLGQMSVMCNVVSWSVCVGAVDRKQLIRGKCLWYLTLKLSEENSPLLYLVFVYRTT
jgi:hypothetical protein